MRLSYPGLSGSPPPPIPRRSKHRRRISSSPSPTEEDQTYSDQQSQYSPSSDPNFSEEPNDNSTNLNSYSDFQSSSNSLAPIPPTPSTYINVAPLPIFRGGPDDCPLAHLSRFERVCQANNATTIEMIVRIFPVTLDGEAALWYELNVEPYPSMSWDEIKSSFLNTYRRPEFIDKARSDLMTIRQGQNESVNAYYLRMQWILKKWPEHGLPDSLLKGILVDGLREDFQDWIVPQRPESLEEAVGLALSWEQVESVRAARRCRVVKCGFCDGKHEERGCEVRRKMREFWMRSKEGSVGGEVEVVGASEGDKAEERREGEGEGEGEEVGRVASLGRRSQCQCWKHQCWKKYDRSNSAVSDRNPAAD